MLNNIEAFPLINITANKGHLQLMSQFLEGKQLITENDDFVASRLMQLHQIVTRHVLIGIVEIQSLFDI